MELSTGGTTLDEQDGLRMPSEPKQPGVDDSELDCDELAHEQERLGLSEDLPVDRQEDGEDAWSWYDFRAAWDHTRGGLTLKNIQEIVVSRVSFDAIDESRVDHFNWFDLNDSYPNWTAVWLLLFADGWGVLVGGRWFVDSRHQVRHPALHLSRDLRHAIESATELMDTERDLLLSYVPEASRPDIATSSSKAGD